MSGRDISALEQSMMEAKMRLQEQERMLCEQERRHAELAASLQMQQAGSVGSVTKEERAESIQQLDEKRAQMLEMQAQLQAQQETMYKKMIELRVAAVRKAELQMVAAELAAQADVLAAEAAANPNARLTSQLEQLKAQLAVVQANLHGESGASGEATTPSTTTAEADN